MASIRDSHPGRMTAWVIPACAAAMTLLLLAEVARGETVTINWEFSRDDLTLQTAGEHTQLFLKNGHVPSDVPGSPALPVWTAQVLIPADAEVVGFVATATETLIEEEVTVYPVQPARTNNDPPAPFTQPDAQIYRSSSMWPTASGSFEGVQRLHGYKLAAVRLYPIRYLPVERSLYLAKTVQATITYNEGKLSAARTPVNQQARARREVADLVSNPQDIDRFAPTTANTKATSAVQALENEELDGDDSAIYLLITNETLAPAFQPLVDRRTAQGKTGKLVTTEWIYANYDGNRPDGDMDSQTRIRDCIIDHYQNHGTVWVALGGDDVIVPVREAMAMVTDLYYACLGGSWDEDSDGLYGEAGDDDADLMPEVWVGRITVRTPDQATAYINKLIRYETRSPDGFANSLLLTSGFTWYMSGLGRPIGYRDHDPVSEGESDVRNLYRNGIQPYWQPTSTGEIFNTFSTWDNERCGDYGLTPARFVERLNWGYHHVYFFDHGGVEVVDTGRGYFWTWDASALTNADRPSIVYMGACHTGNFTGEPSLGEAFLRNPDGGAVAFIGASNSHANTTYYAGLFYRELFQNRPLTLGEGFARSKLRWVADSNVDGVARGNQLILNLQADPALLLLGEETGRHLQVLSPNGCEVIDAEGDITIRWNAAGTSFLPDEQVTVEYSGDAGATWHTIPGAESRAYDSRLFIWENPSLPAGSQYRTRVVSLADLDVKDESDRNFTIAPLRMLTVQSTPLKGIWISGSQPNSTPYTFTVQPGSEVSLTAPGADGYNFTRWTDANGNTITHGTTVSFVMSGNKTVTAEYQPVGSPRDYYVNDEITEDGFAAGDDSNQGFNPNAPVRHIQQILDRYDDIATIHVSSGLYRENVILAPSDTEIVIQGSGAEQTAIDGGQAGSCLFMDNVGSVSLRGVTLRNGQARYGGGFFIAHGSITVQECSFSGNVSTESGGAVFCAAGARTTVIGSSFTGNSAAPWGGGALYADQAESVRLVNCGIRNNQARYGGGLHVRDGLLTVENCVLEANSVTESGGGMFCDIGARAVIIDTTFIGNTADWGGGGLYSDDAVSVKLAGCELLDNEAAVDGAGVYVRDVGDVMIAQNRVIGNRAGQFVGGVCLLNVRGTVVGNIIARNRSNSTAAGLHLTVGTAAAVVNNIIAENESGAEGGGIDLWSSTATIVGNLISGNRAVNWGAGICLRGTSRGTIIGNTLSANAALSYAGGLLVADGSAAEAMNCVFSGNTAPTGTQVCVWAGSALDIGYCNVRGGSGAAYADPGATLNWLAGNIDADPLFVDPAGPDGVVGTADDDLRLGLGSPCIDAGNNAAVPTDSADLDGDGNTAEPSPVDLAGHARFLDDLATPDCQWAPGTCGTAPIVDMGAYEFIPVIPGDFDGDGNVGLDDLAAFQVCVSAPAVAHAGDCAKADFDHDNDVDQSDFGLFQRCFSGESNPADPNCAN